MALLALRQHWSCQMHSRQAHSQQVLSKHSVIAKYAWSQSRTTLCANAPEIGSGGSSEEGKC